MTAITSQRRICKALHIQALGLGLLLGECPQVLADLITNRTKCREALLFRSLSCRGIFKTVMEPVGVPRVNWTALLCVIANGKNVIESGVAKLIHMLGSMPRDVDAQLLHHRDGFRPNSAGFRPSTEDIEAVVCVMAQKPFSHLTTGRITRTKNQYPLLARAQVATLNRISWLAVHFCATSCTTSQGLPSGGV